MKKFYRIHFYPKISPNGELVHLRDCKEILNVLGFCDSQTLPAEVESEVEVEGSSGLGPVLVGPTRKIISNDHRTFTINKEVRSKGQSRRVKVPS